MRVTMLVRCLAMMRGGGETRHLAWMRELQSLGVEVDVITGQPLLLGGARFPIAGVTATMLRSPYLRDVRLPVSAPPRLRAPDDDGAARRRRVVLPRGVARDRQRPAAPDVVHAHALHQAARLRRGVAGRGHESAGRAESALHRRHREADALVADGWAAARVARPARPPGARRCRRAWMPSASGPTARSCARELGLDRQARRARASAGSCRSRTCALLIEAMAHASRERDADAHLLIVGEGPELARLEARVERLGIADCVTFAGYVPAGRTRPVLPIGRRVRALVRFRQLAERRARSDGLRPAGGRDRCRRRRELRRPIAAASSCRRAMQRRSRARSWTG